MMKKILIIGMSSILGGVETYIYNLVRYSNRKKYNYDFLVIGNKKSVFESEINNLFLDNKNHFYYCPNLKKNFFEGMKWLKSFYKHNKYDIVYMNTCTSAKILYCIFAYYNGTLIVTHSHNGNGNSKINNALFRPILKKCSLINLSCSDLATKWLYGKNAENVEIIQNGIDVERFQFNQSERNIIRKKLYFNDNDIVIGHVGRFSHQKNHNFFIKLAQMLPQNYKFLFIGDGELKKTIEDKIELLGLSKKFRILPSKNDIENYYSAMDLFVMPSIYEGLPIVSIEAQANGLNCIFSDTISKQSSLSKHCTFLKLNNIELWVRTIIGMKYDRYDGKEKILEHNFDVSSTAKKIENLFEKING